jgi:hypothetical protein
MMNERDVEQVVPNEQPEGEKTQMLVNDYGAAKDPAVVIDEPNRTVLLTPGETIIIEKQETFDIPPKNRPRKVYSGMWGSAEIATVGMAMLAVLTVILLYLFLVAPSSRELEQNRAERDRLEKDLTAARSKYGSITSTESQVAKLVSSASDFETNYLPVAAIGKNAFYQRLNGLISANGLVNTSGPDYTPLEAADQNPGQQSDEERGRAKYRSLFPGMYVTTTLEGSYQNLRRFISQIERGSEFVVISAVELEPSDTRNDQKDAAPQNPAGPAAPYSAAPIINNGMPGFNPAMGQPAAAQAQRPRGKTHGEVVSLRLEMAVYFRRPNFVPAPAVTPGQ